MHRKAFQARHRNQSGGRAILFKVETEALGRDGIAHGGLTEQKRV